MDSEDLQVHYNLMLCYQGLGNAELADREQKLYLRFKADESAQAITGPVRLRHPEANNERQPIHEHVSVPLGVPASGHRKVVTTRPYAKATPSARQVSTSAPTGNLFRNAEQEKPHRSKMRVD